MDQQIVTNGNLISYRSFNPQTGETAVVFLHGWRSNKEVWQGVINKLQNTGYSIYTLDLPGFGTSSLPKRVFFVQDYMETVAEFIKKLNLKDVILVGHSFGGRVGIKLAAMQPGLVKKLVLVDSAGFATAGGRKTFFRLIAKIVKPLFYFSCTQGLRKKLYQFIGAEDYLATPGLQKTFVNIVSEDLTQDMEKISCPTLIIWGEDDKETPVEFGQRMYGLISTKGGSASGGHNSKFVILSDAGHFSFLDKPQEFVVNLLNFL